ncbi:hypothetical protein Q5530_15870 [Saccharothrix sp. BKS2]|uniref:hypothetical protein n=1 Tax=Saccharothrix sp. BKS2 TaxID=3064400 RepID=UPI0039E9143E
MTRRALFAVLALIAGFVVVAHPSEPAAGAVAVSAVPATVAGTQPAGTTTRGTPTHPVQQAGHLGQPLDGVQPPVHATPAPPVRVDVVDPAHRRPERTGHAPLGERAPPPTPGS